MVCPWSGDTLLQGLLVASIMVLHCPVCYVWLLIHRQKLWVIVFALLLLLGFQYFHHVLDPLLELHLGLSS